MPLYFYQSEYTSKAAVCSSSLDATFLLTIIDDFKKIITVVPTGKYPLSITADLRFESSAKETDVIVLSLHGTVIFIYQQMFKEPYPLQPNSLQIQRINAIWTGIGHPENIIPS